MGPIEQRLFEIVQSADRRQTSAEWLESYFRDELKSDVRDATTACLGYLQSGNRDMQQMSLTPRQRQISVSLALRMFELGILMERERHQGVRLHDPLKREALDKLVSGQDDVGDVTVPEP